MSRIVLSLAFAALAASSFIGQAAAANAAVGDRVDPSIFCHDARRDDWSDALKLVVLMPSHSDYQGMLRLAFNRYFRAGDAFSEASSGRRTPIRVVYVDGEENTAADAAFLFMENDCVPAGGEALARIAQATGTAMPRPDGSDATVLLLDRDDVVRWRDDAYRAQGERLKPLEAAVKSLMGMPDPLAPASTEAPPQVGESAPDFAIPPLSRWTPAGMTEDDASPQSRLSALRGKVVLVAFYPAAFSGSLPTVDATPEETAADALRRERQRMMSCALQIDELDLLAPDAALRGDVVKLAISASTPELLAAWRRTLRTRDIHYVNDADHAVARRYGSYDAQAGYNLRKVFVVGRDGRIAYVDEDYAPGDAQAVADALEAAAKAR